MKDFAKSIYEGNAKVGNSNKAEIIEKKKKEGATLKVDNGQKLEFSDGSTYVKTSFSDDYREAHNYTGNTKAGNGITKFGLGKYVIADGHKAIVLGEKEERGPNGIPFGWVTIRWVEGPWKGQRDQYYDYDLKTAGNKKAGNSKVGNADIYSGNYIIMGDDGDVWFRDEHEDVSIKYIDSWAQKKIAAYQRSIDEIKKGVAEAKQQAKKYGLL